MPLPLCEVRVFSRRYRFAGTLDVLGRFTGGGPGGGVLLDYKTGRPDDVAADLQTAAYYGALLEMRENGETSELLAFDELTHTYTLEGVRLPSVTQILQRAGLIDFSKIPGPILLAARDRGAAVHRAIHYLNEGDLDPDFEHEFPEYWPYVAAWINFVTATGFRCATADDVPELTHVERFAVQLRKDRRYVLEPYRTPSDYREFLDLRRAQQLVDARRPNAWRAVIEAA